MPYKMQYWNDSLSPYPYDPNKAKQLLAKGGYPHGFNTFLITVSGDVRQAEAVVVKSELAQVGINVDIQSYELLTAYDKEDNGHSQMGERYWTNDIIDPDEVATFGAGLQGRPTRSTATWCSTEATKLVNQARAELDPAKRQQMYDQIQQIVYDESPYLVIDYSPYRYGVGDWVHGFHQPAGLQPVPADAYRSHRTEYPWRRRAGGRPARPRRQGPYRQPRARPPADRA